MLPWNLVNGVVQIAFCIAWTTLSFEGWYMANIFIHFEPKGHTLHHTNQQTEHANVHAKCHDALEHGVVGHENDDMCDLEEEEIKTAYPYTFS